MSLDKLKSKKLFNSSEQNIKYNQDSAHFKYLNFGRGDANVYWYLKGSQQKFLSLNGFSMHDFFLHLPKKIQEYVDSHFIGSKKDDRVTTSVTTRGNNKATADVLNLNLERQLQAWKENPSWVDHPPNVKVSVPKGSLCNLNVEVNVGLPPDAVFDIVIDPDNKRVFKNIKEVISRKVLLDEGPRQVVDVEQAAIWKFLWWSGTFPVRVLVDQNRENHSMKFKQVKTGFMERFEGSWRVEPILVDEEFCYPYKPKDLVDYVSCTKGKGRIASKVSLEQYIQPSIVPPPPISWYIRGITRRTTEMIINDLLAEAARIRGSHTSEESKELPKLSEDKSDEYPVADTRNIKERWALRRRNAKPH